MQSIDLRARKAKNIFDLGKDFCGKSPNGEEIGFTNYYMTKNKKPFFGISGEIHFSRCKEIFWEDELNKMKLCGINIVATYVFWNHHEEKEGVFDFSAERNLRKFIELCDKLDLYVIIRIGPFDHGEVRNGGLPDWLYGKSFDVRVTNDGFLQCVKNWYGRIFEETKNLFYKDGGPIIGTQIDNEYMHSAAVWEITTGTANEWITMGHEGNFYMERLKKLAKDTGIETPFYTCTAWGKAATPDDMLPLWGGYAYRPWLFYSRSGEHPLTEEYIYADFHNNKAKPNPEFEPFYKPEEKPYSCCEMGGGMFSSYNYRFQLAYKSIDAMSNIKMASGCNFLGYYMFKGGTNPKGNQIEFLNESQAPKLSYDFQAALGEFGQIRESYKRLKAIHYFTEDFGDIFCDTQTFLPDGAREIIPSDLDTLRYAVRMKDNSGFVFINNFQDHAETKPKENESIEIILDNEKISIDDISLAPSENCMLPFNMDLSGICLKYSLAQPVLKWHEDGGDCYLFFVPDGMKEKFVFEEETAVDVSTHSFGNIYDISKSKNKKSCRIITISRSIMNNLYRLNIKDKTFFVIYDGALIFKDNSIQFETSKESSEVFVYPKGILAESDGLKEKENNSSIWGSYELSSAARKISVDFEKVGESRYLLNIPQKSLDGKEAILMLKYEGDIGQAFIDGDMIHDNFYNSAKWELGLSYYKDRIFRNENKLTVYITPLKKGAKVNVESTMAARSESVDESIGVLHSAEISQVFLIETKIRFFLEESDEV